MRKLVLALVLIPGLVLAQQQAAPPPPPPAKKPPATQNQVYKWVDEQGVVHYTDKPPADGAKPAKLPPLQTYKEGTNPKLNKFEKRDAAAKTGSGGVAQVDVVTPAHDETFRGSTVPVAVMVTPQLEEGQRLIYLLDGTPASQPTGDTSFALTGVERGTHTVSVTVVDATGTQLGSSTGVTFHVKQQSVDGTGLGQKKPPANKPPQTKPPTR